MPRRRYFTVAEANRLIPTLERELAKLRKLRQQLAEIGAELTPMFEVIRHNGGHPKSQEFIKLAGEFRENLEHLHSHGCLVKDLDPGLVDFPHLREGKEVYLCWRSGETEIQFWHDIDAGFTGRTPL